MEQNMNNINLVMVEGFLVKDPEYKQIKNQFPLCKFVVGSNRNYKRKDGEKVSQTLFLEVSTWMKMAEVCARYLKKGSRVLVTGNLRKDVWKDNTGRMQSKTFLEGKEVNFLSRGRGEGGK